jgi:hypothetical protein
MKQPDLPDITAVHKEWRKQLLYVSLIVAFAGLVRIPSLTQPLGPDQGIMSVIGKGILEGKLPYRDFWEMGSPAVFFTYALIFKIFGTRMWAVPLSDLIVSMLTTYLIFLIAKSVWNKNAGYVAALLFAFLGNGVRFGMHSGGDVAFGTFWYIAQRETFMLPLVSACFYFLLRSDGSRYRLYWLGLSGFAGGLAVMYKFPGMIVFLCIPFYLVTSAVTSGDRWVQMETFRRLLSLGLGFSLAFIPFLLFFWTHGILREMIDVIFGYVASVYGAGETNFLGLIKTALVRAHFIAEENFILWIFFLASSLYILVAERKRRSVLIIGWAFTALLFLLSHREFFGYHFLMLLPPFCLLSGYGLVKSLGPAIHWRHILSTEQEKVFVILALTANFAFFTTLNYLHYTKFYYYVTGKITKEMYYSYFNAYPKHDFSFPADYAVAHYIARRTGKSDCVATMGGTEAIINFLSDRVPASRFVFSWVLFQGKHSEVERAERYRQEFLGDLKKNQPRYVVSIGSIEKFSRFNEIYSYLSKHYFLEKVFPDDRLVYARRPFEN